MGGKAKKTNRSKKGGKKTKRFSALNLLWIIPLAIAAAFAVMMYLVPALDKADDTPVPGSADWMMRLPDDRPLSEVVIPGTHDSATQYVQLGYFSKCQDFSIAQQLEKGYRYLDIRLGVDGDRLKLMHGFTACTEGGWPWSRSLYLDGVLDDCIGFLKAHPSEIVLFAVKQEHGSESVSDFQRLLCTYIEKDPDMWLLTDGIPTVGEARGKIVLLRRYNDEAVLGLPAGVPHIWIKQKGYDDVSLDTVAADNGTYILWAQDRYEYGAEDKWTAFVNGMKKAETGPDSAALNYLSTKGTSTYGHPYKYAKILNKRLMETDMSELRGWIIVDYASAAIAEHIYGANFMEP
ncbi:MAG: hypothetical protein IJM18_08180 [Clostridia bacterium]|nr:hypothetical protein [Clostridia bacterium]